jgi:hypothetical protein
MASLKELRLTKFLLCFFILLSFIDPLLAQAPSKIWRAQTKDRRKLKKTYKKEKSTIFDKYSEITRSIKSKHSKALRALELEEKKVIEAKKAELTKELYEKSKSRKNKNPYFGALYTVIIKGRVNNILDRMKEDYKRKVINLDDEKSRQLIELWGKKNKEVTEMAMKLGFYSYPVPKIKSLIKPERMKAKRFEKEKARVKKSFLKDSTRIKKEFLVFDHYRSLNELRWKTDKSSRLKGIDQKLKYVLEKEAYLNDLEQAVEKARVYNDPKEQKIIAEEVSNNFQTRAIELRKNYAANVKALSDSLKKAHEQNNEILSKELDSKVKEFRLAQESLLN